MTRPRPTLEGVDADHADAFARRRILAWRHTCRGSGRGFRFSLVGCADVNAHAAGDPVAGDLAWWEGARGLVPRDQGSRIDIVLRLIAGQRGARVVAVWERVGPNELLQSDLGWAAAVRHVAADRALVVPSLLVVTRWGWRCLPADTSRTWKRLRA